jgi:DMSO/TMAO reductase YedYZ molybdopterin-dependent catalytic subunit
VYQPVLTRREALRAGVAGAVGLSVLTVAGPATAAPPAQGADTVVVPWLDQPPPVPEPAQGTIQRQLVWEELDDRITPNTEHFVIAHYGIPDLSASSWRLSVGGLVARPLELTLDALQSQPRHEVEFTMECSGNNGPPFFTGGIGNARWAGAQLRRLLCSAQPTAEADEVVFWGVDRGPVTIRDNSGITAAGATGTTTPDDGGGLDLMITERFARSMTLEEALAPENLVAYSMNDAPLPAEHGFPARLIAPGWYGVANVKWLTTIELTSERLAGRFMARDYVTIREETRGDDTVWTFTTVGKDRLKSAPARVTRTGAQHTITGVAWGAPVSRVEVSIDGGPFQPTQLPRQGSDSEYSWRFWTYDWGTPAAGEHTVQSRAYDADGNVQPAPDDPFLASRRTYWEANGQITRRVRID